MKAYELRNLLMERTFGGEDVAIEINGKLIKNVTVDVSSKEVVISAKESTADE